MRLETKMEAVHSDLVDIKHLLKEQTEHQEQFIIGLADKYATKSKVDCLEKEITKLRLRNAKWAGIATAIVAVLNLGFALLLRYI